MAEQALTRRVDPPPERIDGHYPTLTRVSAWPRLYVRDDVLTPADCAALARIRERVERGELDVPGAKHDATGWSVEAPRAMSAAVGALAATMEEALGFRSARSSTLRYRSYAPSEWHPVHADHFEIDGAWLVATAMVCVEAGDGGETVFPHACPPIAVAARAGRLAIWFNHVATGQPDPLSAHFAATVRRGRKTTLTLFAYADPETCLPLRHGLRTVNDVS